MLGKDYRVPREIDERELVFDARPKSAQDAVENLIRDIKEAPEPHQFVEYFSDDPPLYVPPKRNPIDRIAEMVRELTYGEMVELATEIWAYRGDGIEEQGLPETLHRWAKSHSK